MESSYEPTNYSGHFINAKEDDISVNFYVRTTCYLKNNPGRNSAIRVKCHRKNHCDSQILSGSTTRIAGGFEVNAGSNKYMVAMFRNGYQKCSGSIIAEKWVRLIFIESIDKIGIWYTNL